jgi:uncharacterized membrane protein YjdF
VAGATFSLSVSVSGLARYTNWSSGGSHCYPRKRQSLSFLGTQGYIFDTQSDMMYALVGAVLGLLLLGKLHDKQLVADGYVDQQPESGES